MTITHIIEQARAKINLYLHVAGRRPDGYHMLDTLMVPLALADEVNVSANDSLFVEVAGDFVSSVPQGKENIVAKAAFALAEFAQCDARAHIIIHKKIPVGGGMAGGSTDAAATLRALNRLWELNYDLATLCEIGVKIGADIPFCLYQQAAFVSGIGEVVEPIRQFPTLHVVLVNPRVEVATPQVFRTGIKTMTGACKKPACDGSEAWLDFLSVQTNDLLNNALLQAPQVKKVLEELALQPKCQLARMSGSGATCFGIFPDEENALAAVKSFHRYHPDWWVHYTIAR